MSTPFPTNLDTTTTLPTESASTPLSVNHVIAHTNIADAVIALETKVGVNSSAVTTTHDYKLSEITGSDKAVGKTANQVLTNKTLTSPTLTTPILNVGSDATGDVYYRNSGGNVARLGVGSNTTVLTLVAGLPAWVAPAVTANASTTVAGISELATAAEINAGTATGGTGAALVVTPDQLLISTPTFNGSGLTGIPVYAVNSDIQDSYFTLQIPFSPTSTSVMPGWTVTGTTPFTYTGAGSYIRMSDSGSGAFTITSALIGSGSTDNYSPAQSKVIRIKFPKFRVLDLSDRKGWGLCITAANIHTAHTDVTNGEVRFILNTSTLYAQNANGSTATSTDISSGLTLTNWNSFEIVFTPAVDIKFYVNGTLKATHTTNLPTTGTLLLAYGASANGRQVDSLPPIISIQN